MGQITILASTTKEPISMIGKMAGVCYGSDILSAEKNYKRGLDCINSQHFRTLEFITVDMVLENYSARVIREYMRHVGGGLSVLQASTRYINEENFAFVTPPSIGNNVEAYTEYVDCMYRIKEAYKNLLDLGIPKEDVANVLPLGMTTKLVDHKNLRNLMDMSHKRLCMRAIWEYRNLMRDMIEALNGYSEEWRTITDMLFKPQCEVLGRCPETKGCGRYAK